MKLCYPLRIFRLTRVPPGVVGSEELGGPGEGPEQGWLGALVGEVLALYREELEDSQGTNMLEDMRKDNMTQKVELEVANRRDMQRSNMTEGMEVWGECRVEVWRCLSSHLEEVARGLHGVSDLLASLHHLLYRATFHGGLRSMWSSVVQVPMVQGVARCLNSHDTCVTRVTLSRWASLS